MQLPVSATFLHTGSCPEELKPITWMAFVSPPVPIKEPSPCLFASATSTFNTSWFVPRDTGACLQWLLIGTTDNQSSKADRNSLHWHLFGKA